MEIDTFNQAARLQDLINESKEALTVVLDCKMNDANIHIPDSVEGNYLEIGDNYPSLKDKIIVEAEVYFNERIDDLNNQFKNL